MPLPSPLLILMAAAGIALAACSGSTSEATPAAAPSDQSPASTLPSQEPSDSSSDPTAATPTTLSPTPTEAPQEAENPCWAGLDPLSPVVTAAVRHPPGIYRRVIPRINFDDTVVTDSITFEANNLDMRGPLIEDRIGPTATEVAARWRDTAGAIGGRIFLLRDSLWSQQDHPYRQDGLCALMIPPSWISAAAFHPNPVAPTAPAESDDEGWFDLAESPELVFGTFPPSERLHELATTAGQDPVTARSARATIRDLADQVEVLLRARDRGAGAVLAAGAVLVSSSDLAYFGAKARRDSIIPILVANPGPAEIEEGKGAEVPGLDVSQADRDWVMATLLAQRLRDGDVAVERYDLSTERDQVRAIALLEDIVPPGPGEETTVWLWVNGKLDPDRKLRGEGPLAYMGEFRARLEDAEIDLGRVELVAKPVVDLPNQGALAVLDEAVSAYQEHHLLVSVTLDSEALLTIVPH